MFDAASAGNFRRNVRWQFVGSAMQALLSGLLLLITGRALSASGFGVFSIVMGFVYVGNLLLEPRMQDVAARQFWDLGRDESAARQSHYFADFLILEIVCKLIPCLALVVLAPLIVRTAHLSTGTELLLEVAAIGTYLAKLGNGLSIGLLRVRGRSDLYVYCAIGELVLRLATLLLLWKFFDLTVLRCIVVLCAAGIVSNIVQWLLTIQQFDGVGGALRAWSYSGATKRLKENRRLLVSNLGLSASDLMNKDLDITLLSPMLPADQIGIYKMAKNITLLTWRAIDPFYLALMPEISRLVSTNEFRRLQKLLFKSSAGLFCLSLALSLSTYGALHLLGGQVLGPAYSNVPGLLPWMLIGVVMSAPLVWGHPLAVALNRAEIAFLGSLTGSIVGLFAFLALTPLYGAFGAGIAWALTFFLGFGSTSIAASYFLRLRYGAKHKH